MKRLSGLALRACRSHLFVAIGVGLCCSGGLLLTIDSTLNQFGGLDPYVYAGYIHDYPDLVARFGRTYYSERIAYIYPERALTYLLGLEGGYFAFRFVALAAAAAAVFSIGRRFYGYAPAILAAVWLSFTPWLPRSLLWTYPDGIAVAYLLVGAAFLFVPTRRRLIYHGAAGAAFALAVNCNLFLLAICGLLGPGWAFFYRHGGVVWLARAILALAIGFFATYLVLSLILYVQFPVHGFFLEGASIREAIELLRGEEQSWYEPLSSIIWEDRNFTLLIPITFVLAAFSIVATRSTIVRTPRDFEVFVISYLASIVCFFLIFHFGFHAFWLSASYYTIYFLPASVLALVMLGGEAERCGGRIFGAAAVYGGIGLILLWWLALPIRPQLEIGFYLWIIVAAVTVAAAMALYRSGAASVVLVAALVLLTTSLYQRSFYQIRGTSPKKEAMEWDVYRGAIYLQQFVNANVRPDEPIGFWYNNDQAPGSPWQPLNSIQSVYLWVYSRAFPTSNDTLGMPLVDDAFRGMLPRYRFLVLLGLSDAETNIGLNALEVADLPFREVKRIRFQGQFWTYAAVLIKMTPRALQLGPLLFDVPLVNLELDPMAVNDGSVSRLSDGLRLSTAVAQWTNSLRGRLRPEQESMQGAAIVRVRLHVEKGDVGIGVSTVGNASKLNSRDRFGPGAAGAGCLSRHSRYRRRRVSFYSEPVTERP